MTRRLTATQGPDIGTESRMDRDVVGAWSDWMDFSEEGWVNLDHFGKHPAREGDDSRVRRARFRSRSSATATRPPPRWRSPARA